jgi:hypothetical protein
VLLWHCSPFGARNFSQADEFVTLLTAFLHQVFSSGRPDQNLPRIDSLLKIRYLNTTRWRIFQSSPGL